MRFGTLLRVGFIALAASSNPAHCDQLLNIENLVGEFSPQNTGSEMVVPFQRISFDSSGIPINVSTRLDVYPLGSTARLYSSTPKTFQFGFPWWVFNYCTIDDFDEPQPGDLIARSSSRLVWASGFSISCSDGNDVYQHDRLWIYGADVGVNSGTSWRFESTGSLSGGFARDTNNDGKPDQIIISYTRTAADGSQDMTMTILNFLTGAVVSSNTYPTLR